MPAYQKRTNWLTHPYSSEMQRLVNWKDLTNQHLFMMMSSNFTYWFKSIKFIKSKEVETRIFRNLGNVSRVLLVAVSQNRVQTRLDLKSCLDSEIELWDKSYEINTYLFLLENFPSRTLRKSSHNLQIRSFCVKDQIDHYCYYYIFSLYILRKRGSEDNKKRVRFPLTDKLQTNQVTKLS